MIIRNYPIYASERHILNNPTQAKRSVGSESQPSNSVSKRRNFKNMLIADSH